MADFTRIANTVAQSTTGNGVTTSAIDTSTAAVIVVVISCNDSHPTLSDSASNSWTAGPTATGSTPDLVTYYCLAPITSASHTFTANGASTFPAIGVFAYSATGAVTLDTSNQQEGVNSTLTTGSVTPSQANCLLVAAVANNAAGTIAVDSSFSIVHSVGLVGGQAFGLSDAEQIQTTATTRNPSFSGSSGVFTGAGIMVFKAAAAAVAAGSFAAVGQRGPGSTGPQAFQWTQQSGVDGARDVSVIIPAAAAVSVAANNSGAAVAPTTGSAAVSVAANNSSATVASTIGSAAVTVTASNSSHTVAPTTGSAAVSVTANNSGAAVAPTIGSAAVTVTANNVTVSTSSNVNVTVGVAAVTVTANNSAAAIASTIGTAAVTVAANDASHQIAGAVGVAAVTVTANNATVSTSSSTNVTVGVATVTATANTAAAAVAAAAIVALVVVTANQAAVDNGAGVATVTRVFRTERPDVFRTHRPEVS